jgi:aldose 1-epimerase
VTAPPPSGEQFEIACDEQRATIVEVGAGVREYVHADRAVLDPYPPQAICDGAHGAVLIPWPNRLADGRYRFDDADRQLALTEPDKHNAIHGLLRWRPWRLLQRGPDRVAMGTRLHPQPGYPFALDASVTYELGERGLVVTTTALNVGDRPCPYGAGQHPYLSPGDALLDECTLTLPAATRIDTDAERQLPTGSEPVAGTRFDFRAGRRLSDLQVDFAFTDLARDELGRATASLAAPDGRTAQLWVDESYPVIEIYTGDTLSPPRRRRGLGVEPMTCWPNAFQNGHGLVRLEPGQAHTASWGVRLV